MKVILSPHFRVGRSSASDDDDDDDDDDCCDDDFDYDFDDDCDDDANGCDVQHIPFLPNVTDLLP
jgi:hypothetical protein